MFDLDHEAMDLGYAIEPRTEPVRDDEPETPLVQPGFQLPAAVWVLMIGCYAIFFASMFMLASGSGFALMMVTIAALYGLMFFGTAGLLAALPGRSAPSPLDQGRPLQTWCGPMSVGAVYSQVLIVPVGIAIFAVSILLIATFA
nr:hypothetical protein [uncultured Sphingomonas sp.]